MKYEKLISFPAIIIIIRPICFLLELHHILTGALVNQIMADGETVYTCGRELTGSGMIYLVFTDMDTSVKYQMELNNMYHIIETITFHF